MIYILSLLIIITLSILVTRVATIALVHTGLSLESARFQSRSAFTGAGYTTAESEQIVNHPVRRRIVMLLMLMGNAGLVTAISSLILTFVSQGEEDSLPVTTGLLAAGLLLLYLLSKSPWVDRHLSLIIEKALKRYTDIDVQDYASLMRLAGDYRLVEHMVVTDSWMAGRTLAELELRDEGIIVLGIRRPAGTYLGAPNGDSRIEGEDTVLIYGRVPAIEAVCKRRRTLTAELRHDAAVEEQKRVSEEEETRAGSGPPEPDRD